MEPMYWLLIFVVLLVIEILTMGLTTIWFAGGALIAFVVGILGMGTIVQIVVFVIVSLVLLFLTRPYAVKYFNKDRKKTNAESLIGQQAVVTEEINTLQAKGVVVVNGLEWSARTRESNGCIPKDSIVVIEEIQGVKLIVRQKEA